MLSQALAKVFGSKQERDVKKLQPFVDAVNGEEARIKGLSDNELKAKTAEFRTRIDQGASLDDLAIEAFAVAREAAWRTLHMRPFDVQVMGGLVLHQGKIAEMKTGEGKTLCATLPVYLNALSGAGVHVVTVNDYLARRDSEWMGQIYQFLGLTVGVIQSDIKDDSKRREAYSADVTYGTNNELGFDYLRDNMKFTLESMVQREHNFAIVDEVDSILIDEARTPLIISGPSEGSTQLYYQLNSVVPRLERGEEHREGDQKWTTGDFIVDEKAQTVSLTEEGVEKVEKLLNRGNLYDMENIAHLHGVNQGLRAHHLFKRDVNYLIKEGQVVIVDEFTGRMMPGRRWSDGLHQAVEAKEGVKIEKENQTLATITFQNYFRMYGKLAGMTGTADTEETEFGEIYKLDVVVVPTNQDMVRDDRGDLIYRSADEKWDAVVDEIKDCHEAGQPVLVGTVSIENSEMLDKMLKRARVKHVVLNAKFHEQEAKIVAQAGRRGAVTIATNMAGRGTDIVLGGNAEALARAEADPVTQPEDYTGALARFEETCTAEREEVLEAGGLHILGTERHESRRIDNQLRGRSGRQGDPGSSRFFLSLEDDLMRIFASDRVQALMGRSMIEGEPLEARMVTRAIEKAQTQVEGRNFLMRKHLLDYDDVMNKQREAIYALRREILSGEEGHDYIVRIASGLIDLFVDEACPERADPRDWKLDLVASEMAEFFDVSVQAAGVDLTELGVEELRGHLTSLVKKKYDEKESELGEELMRDFAREVMLQVTDQAWKEHLLALDHLKEGINLRGYGHRDPKNEYKRESYELFQEMKDHVEDAILKRIFKTASASAEQIVAMRQFRSSGPSLVLRGPEQSPGLGAGASAPTGGTNAAQPPRRAPQKPQTVRRDQPKIGRNEPCYCGSGKKFKKCHGAAHAAG